MSIKVKEAAQAAVEAFDLHGYSPLTIKAIWALRDALAKDKEKAIRCGLFHEVLEKEK